MTINLPLSDVIEQFIDEQAASKGYSNPTEYVLSLIHQEQARVNPIESLLLAGLDRGSPIEVTDNW